MDNECIFCKIIGGEIPSEFLYQDDDVVAFRDISPAAPVHILIVSREHIQKLSDITASQDSLIGKMVAVANRLAVEQDIAESGYRVIINCGKDGGQVVPHLHMHLIGGRRLGALG